MKKLVTVACSKSTNDDNERFLDYYFKFKNEEFADKFMNLMEDKFEEYGYEFKFWRCPEVEENGVYHDAFSVPFMSGEMKEIKENIREIFNDVKNELGVK